VVLTPEPDRTPRRRRLTRLVLAALAVAVAVSGYVAVKGVVNNLGPTTCQATASGDSVAFSPEQTANAALISALSVKRGLPPRAATIAIATAIQESKLRNLRVGDRDSVGLFQQRPSQGWGTPEQLVDPVYATNKFYDALVKVKDYQTREITQVAQEVQRSAFPEAYADHEQEGRVLASTLTGRSPAGLGCRLDPVAQAVDGAAVRADLTNQMGVTARVEGAVLTLLASDAEQAWAVAAWAVARAEAYGIGQVRVGDRSWMRTRDPGGLTWGAGATGGSGPANTVTIHLGP